MPFITNKMPRYTAAATKTDTITLANPNGCHKTRTMDPTREAHTLFSTNVPCIVNLNSR